MFYVYAYLRSDNTPYYIGKGQGDRAFNKQHNVIVPKDKSRVVFLETNLTELGAFALERRYIKWYGRKNDRSGILRNLTDGGEGISGFAHSDETKRLMSEAAVGRKHTEETKRKISEFRQGKPRPPRSEEHCRKISESNSGRVRTEEHRRKLSEALKGIKRPPRSEEHRRKLSEATRGKSKK